MGVKNFKPTSPARRYYSVSDFKELSKDTEPLKKLTEHQTSTGGRNHYGRITSRFRGGGHKQRYRIIDWKRNKIGVPAIVATIEYDPEPHGAHRAAALRGRRQALHPRARRDEGGRQDRLEPQRRHQARQLDDAPLHPARHDDPQHRAQEGQGRPARPRRRRPPPRSWRRTATTPRCACPRARCAGPPRVPRDHRAGVEHRSTRTSRSARPVARAGSAAGRTTAASR